MILSESPRIEFLSADCMDVMKGYADKQFELAIVDPPYGIDFQSNMRVKSERFEKLKNDNNNSGRVCWANYKRIRAHLMDLAS